MKSTLAFLLVLSAGQLAFAKLRPLAVGTVELYQAARSYEVVIDGDAAAKIFQTLDAPENIVKEWRNKSARGMTCGENMRTKKYSCSLQVDRDGVQQ